MRSRSIGLAVATDPLCGRTRLFVSLRCVGIAERLLKTEIRGKLDYVAHFRSVVSAWVYISGVVTSADFCLVF